MTTPTTTNKTAAANTLPDDAIELNVGGVHYTTTVKTLVADADSLLAELIAGVTITGSSTTPAAERKQLFIDRDGQLFRYVLDYLRNGRRLVLPDPFLERERLRLEAEYYRLPELVRALPTVSHVSVGTGRRSPSPGYLDPSSAAVTAVNAPLDGQLSPKWDYLSERRRSSTGAGSTGMPGEPGCIIVGYRGTFAFGRDGGVADVKFRKLWRILISGRVALCKEVFGDTLNDSRDPDRGDGDRYSSRFFLKHTFLEQAFDNLLDSGFRLVAACGSGTNSAGDSKPGMDTEESRWNHYNEFVFVRP